MLALLPWLLSAAVADPLTFEAVRVVEHGRDVPRVIFVAGESGRIDATATCAGRTWRLARALAAGTRAELRLDGIREGTWTCDVEVTYRQDNGADGAASFPVEVASLRVLQLSATLDDIDLGAGTAVVHADRPVASARVTVYGVRNAQLDQTRADLSDPRQLRFRWDAGGREVVKLLVEAEDDHGFRSELELIPWRYQIPHEDVIFETDSDVVRDSEIPKLENAWAEVQRVVEMYGSVAPTHLFVAGYTDTVGDAASNQALSERRARAIARWFQARGFPGEVYYQGFGESVLAVPTADNVDEARNRRAIYVVAAQPPPAGGELPRTAWKRL